jgi:hypothetical protein
MKAEDGAIFKTDLKEVTGGWQASYRFISKNLDTVEATNRWFSSRADAVAWLTAEATAHGFVYEPPI